MERPKYGSLNFRARRAGGSPRFGSAYLRLAADTMRRATFCYQDSFLEPEHFGTACRVSALVARAEADSPDALDDYIEAHVHGVVSLVADVEALVLDPCYRGTPVEAAARTLACPVAWHSGFSLPAAEMRRHPAYRGQEYVNLGESLACGGLLDPKIIGDAARSGQHDDQALKRIWHYVARFGGPELRSLPAMV